MWWLLLFLFLGVIAWILFAPIFLEIDSESNLYHLQWQGIGRVEAGLKDQEIIFRFKIFFWKKDFYPLRKKSPSAKPKDKKKAKRKSSFSLDKISRKRDRLIKSFRLIYFQLHLDTGDYVRNGYWYPVFYWLSTNNRQLRINFEGDNRLKLKIENCLGRILYALMF